MVYFKQNYAVLIGINNYRNGIPILNTAVADAAGIAQILQDKHGYQVQQYLDEAATLEKLRTLLQGFLTEIEADDRLIFYFAGHGIALNGDDGPQGYLIPQDARLGEVSTYLPMVEVEAALTQLPCRHCLIILDCCFGGAFRWSSTRKLVPVTEVIYKERYDRFVQDPAWQVITSAAHDQYALDALDLKNDRGIASASSHHSPFAAALMEALVGAADAHPPAQNGQPAGDGVITATELYLYLRDRVEVATETQQQRQTPGIWPLNCHDKGEYIFLSPGHALNLPPAPPLDTSKNPYRGLESFDEAQSELFFGRAALTKALAQFVAQHPLTVVLGASGSGKSSLVKAGLMPFLRRQGEQDSRQPWQILDSIRPGEAPFKALRNALLQKGVPAAVDETTADADLLSRYLAAWCQHHTDRKLLLVIDQFEELITLNRDEPQAEEFLMALVRAIASYPDQLRLVLTLRSDFEPQFQHGALKESWSGARFVVPPMTRAELRESIEEPASHRVMYFQSDDAKQPLVDQLIDEVADMPGALPLLSFTLSELYLKYLERQDEAKKRGDTIDRAITEADYRDLGGVARSLTRRADQEYEALVMRSAAAGTEPPSPAPDPAYDRTIRHVMLRMVSVGGGELARRRVPLSELEYPPEQNERVREVIERFLQARLLVKGTDPEGQPYVEPAHDALVRGWQRLLKWTQEQEEDLLLQRRLTPAAEEWRNQQKPRFLWNTNPRLDLLKKVLHSDDSWLNRVETDFVRRSVGRRNFNTRRNWGVAIAVMIGLGTGLVFSLIGQKNTLVEQIAATRESAEAKLLANQELDALTDGLRAGTLLKNWPWYLSVFTVEESLKENVTASLRKMVYRRETERWEAPAGFRDMFFTDDGQLITLTSDDDRIRLTGKYGRQIAEIPGRPFRSGIGVSPDGSKIAVATPDGRVQLWNLQGEKISEFQAYRGLDGYEYSILEDIAFSPDGDTIVTAGVDIAAGEASVYPWEKDKVLRLWNLSGEKINETEIENSQFWGGIGFDANGNVLLATLMEGNSGDYRVKVSNLSGEELAVSENIGTTAFSIRFDPNGQKIGIEYGEESNNILVLNLESGESLEITGRADVLRFNSNSDFFYAGVDGTIYNASGEAVLALPSGTVTDFVFNPGDQQLITVGDDQLIRVWDIQNQPSSKFRLDRTDVVHVGFAPDEELITIIDAAGVIHLLDAGGEFIREFSQLPRMAYLSFSPDGETIAAAAEDGTVHLLNLQGDRLAEFQAHERGIESISWSPDGQRIATIGDDGDKLRLWDLGGNPLGEKQTDIVSSFSFRDIEFTKTGEPVIVTRGEVDQSFGNVNLADFSGKRSINIIPGRQVGNYFEEIKLSRDTDLLITTSQNIIEFWNLSGRKLLDFSFNGIVKGVSPSPTNSMLAVTTDDGTTEILRLGGLDDLLTTGCRRIQNYLRENPNLSESDRTLCDNVASMPSASRPESSTVVEVPTAAPTVTPASPSLSPALTSMDFGVQIGTAQSRWVEFTNDGNSPITINDLRLANDGSAPFEIVGQSCAPAVIDVRQSCAVEVQFLPTMAGDYTSKLQVRSSEGTMTTIPLRGNAVED
ncbi:MAG: caspase family protein [Synechococcales bacterium]|nr:caspase family protein [Synechococcales bacterium]